MEMRSSDTPDSEAAIGEIVEASTTRFRAVARETFAPPGFGTFVRTSNGERATYGIVAHIEHASLDPSRRAIPLGRTWEELRREQPQVLELLTTEFEAVCVAFADRAGPINPYLPPVPPRVHEFVEVCSAPEMRELTDDLTFIRTLAASGTGVAAELIAAAIRGAAQARSGDEGSGVNGRSRAVDDSRVFLLRAGREVADVYRQDYEQACAILRRLGMRVAGDEWERRPAATVSLRGESGK